MLNHMSLGFLVIFLHINKITMDRHIIYTTIEEPCINKKKMMLWWRTICSYCVSCLDHHVTYYTSHVCTYVYTRLSLPCLKYTVVA
jgi:hypothetical protein